MGSAGLFLCGGGRLRRRAGAGAKFAISPVIQVTEGWETVDMAVSVQRGLVVVTLF